MAIQLINLGTYANDGTGDDLRTAFQRVNANFILLSGEVTDGANLGNGTGIFADKTANLDFGNTLNFKSIVGGNNLTVTHDGATITLAVNNPLIGNVTGDVTGNVTGNAGSVTNGVYTTGAYGNPSWINSLAKSKVGLSNVENIALSTWNGSTNITTVGVLTSLAVLTTINSDLRGNVTGNVSGNVSGNAGTVTNGVYTTGNQTIGGTKTFSNTITGNVSGNAGTVTNGVYTTSSIDALADVETTGAMSPINGQALVWNSTMGHWMPGSVVTQSGNNNFDFGVFKKIFTDPISYLLDKTGMDVGTFASPAAQSVNLGTF